MKKLMVLCSVLVLMLSIVACSTNNNDNSPQSDTQQSDSANQSEEQIQSSSPNNSLVAWANWSDDPDIVTRGLNFNKMSISSVQHLPIFKCEKQSDLDDFKNQFKDSLNFSSDYDEVPSFEETTAGFGTDFFNNNTLFLVYVSANSGSLRFALDSYSVVDDTFRADIIQTNNPEVVTDNMAGWLIVIPVSNDQLESVQNYDAVMK